MKHLLALAAVVLLFPLSAHAQVEAGGAPWRFVFRDLFPTDPLLDDVYQAGSVGKE